MSNTVAKYWPTLSLLLVSVWQPALLWGDEFKDLSKGVTIEGIVAFCEGPAYHPSGNVYFTDIVNNRIMRRDSNGALHIFRTPSGRANGLLFDHQGRLLACEGAREGGNRRVTRTELDGTITVLAENFEGKRLNSPNDVAIDRQGRIYFSDPRYGDDSDLELFDNQGKRIEGVYRIDLDGSLHRVLEHEVDRPNGLAISPDGKTIYVADNVNDGPQQGVGGARKLWRFALNRDGSVQRDSGKVVFDWGTERGPDGLTIDVQGRVYAAAGFNFPKPPAETADRHKAGIYIFSPNDKLLGVIPIPEDMITNCTFGDADLKTLYITAGHKLWSVKMPIAGAIAWPPAK